MNKNLRILVIFHKQAFEYLLEILFSTTENAKNFNILK